MTDSKTLPTIKEKELDASLKLTDHRAYYQPLRYPFAYNFSEEHRRMNWTREEVKTLHEDVADWNAMTEEERAPRQFLLNYFVQADVDVAGSYIENMFPCYTQPELRMALVRIVDREATHVDCYQMLPDQFGIPKTEYAEMLTIDEIADQHDFMIQKAHDGSYYQRLTTICRHICGEGIGLYGIFLMLLNDQRFGRMKSLGQEVVSWSSRDENHHCFFLTWLFNTELEENQGVIPLEEIRDFVIAMFKNSVQRGVSYAKAVYKRGALPGLTVEEIETFLMQLANVRIKKLNIGVEKIYDLPDYLLLDWASTIFSASLDNFFETAGTNYQIGAMSGEWEYPPADFKKESDYFASLMDS